MNRSKPILLLVSTLFAWNGLYAVDPRQVKQFINNKEWNFVENKGQLANENSNHTDIKYYGHEGNAHVYCLPRKISFVFIKVGSDEQVSEAAGIIMSLPTIEGRELKNSKSPPSKMTTDRIDLELLNSNSEAKIIASGQKSYYENFYLAHTQEKGITNVHTYKTITYKLIYPNIDMVLHTKDGGLKYEFVVYPGGKVSDIQLQWKGLENIRITGGGGIEYAMDLRKMDESKPVSFQDNNIVSSSFVKDDNRVQFKVGKYDKTKTLVIDPILSWGTYFGGSNWDRGTTLSTDKDGNVFMAGLSYSPTGIATVGAYQGNNGAAGVGEANAFIAKFSSNGGLLWATFYGGDSGTWAYGASTDRQGNIYITGGTGSSSGIATANAFQPNFRGSINSYADEGGDAFLAKFSGSGSLIWATYYGGELIDFGQGVAVDGSGNAYITGYTTSRTGIASNNAYQKTYGGDTDAFVAKFNDNGLQLWSTYFGGGERDVGEGITSDSLGNVYITGFTQSKSGIATKGAFQSSMIKGDNYAAFLARFNNLGTLIWSTYYGGTGFDYGGSVARDVSGNVYIYGETHSDSGIATKGAYQTSLMGAGSTFLAKFTDADSLIWATYYGETNNGLGNEDPLIAIDRRNNIYITGYTTSPTHIATKGAWQSKYAGDQDAYLADFDTNGSLKWATYYGGDSLDEACAIAADNYGNVFITGITFSTTGIGTKGSFMDSFPGYKSDDGDAFLAKFSFMQSDNDGGIASILPILDTICPDMQPVIVLLKNYGKTPLQSVTIELEINVKVQKSYSWTGNLLPDSVTTINLGTGLLSKGNYYVKAWTTNPNGVKDSVPGNDTSFTIYNISSPDAHWTVNSLGSLTKTFLAIDGQYQLSDYNWNFGDGATAIGNPVTHIYQDEGEFKVELTLCSGEYDSSIWVINTPGFSIFPNPFFLLANIQYKLPYPTHIKITVFDMLGRYVTTLLNNNLETGEYNTVFNAANLRTRPGIYTIVFMDDNDVITKQIIQVSSIFY